MAVGNPLGMAGSVTAGIVSGLGRALPVRTRNATRIVEDVIQTDAALNPGNSGGALADSRGRVVGINTAVAGVGLGLAVPINATSRRIIYALMHDGRVRRGYLGLVTTPAPLPPEWVTRTGSLLFIWDGECGYQPVLMPGYTYYWWLDDPATLHERREGEGGGYGAGRWRH